MSERSMPSGLWNQNDIDLLLWLWEDCTPWHTSQDQTINQHLSLQVFRYFCLFIYQLFNDTVNSLDYKAMNNRMICEWWIVMDAEERGMIWSTTSTFTWRKWGNPWKTSIRIVFWPRIKPSISRPQVRSNALHWSGNPASRITITMHLSSFCFS